MNLPLHLPHRRYNPLKDEWVLVSPQRATRPWQGKQEVVSEEKRSPYDPSCYLCPGNVRVNGEKNPQYEGSYVFTNDFQALIATTPLESRDISPLLKAETVQGTCRVACFSPRHDLTLADMDIPQIQSVIATWQKEAEELGRRYQWVQIFENKGALMGCSNPHPHGQIWASNFLPNEIAKEDLYQNNYHKTHRSPLLLDYVYDELQKKERVVFENASWVVLVPFWAVWPFETMLLPKIPFRNLLQLTPSQQRELAEAMKYLLKAYDELFGISMPYSMGWHFAPFDNLFNQHWQLHAHYYPPLLRSAAVKKFMVGYEMLAEAQRDITPEQAATRLKELITALRDL